MTDRRTTLAVLLLALGQTIVWAGVFYSFAALLPAWEQAFDWGKERIALGLTLALAVSALASPLVGAGIDAGYGRALLGGGALLGAALMAALTLFASQAGFLAIWALIGLAQAAALYEPCFAVIVRALGAGARAAITRVTLIAGFAGAIAYPTGALLAETLGWRGAALIFAAATALIAAPALWVGAGLLPGVETASAATAREDRSAARAAAGRAMRAPAFAALALAATALALGHGMIVTHLLPLLAERGAPLAIAVLAAASIGPMQVAGRFAMMMTERRVSARSVALAAFAALSLGPAMLFAAGSAPALLISFACLQGAGMGVLSVLRPVLAADALGRTGFGRINGALATAYMGGFAAAPLLGALFWRMGGYDAMLAASALFAMIGFASIAALRHGRD